VLLAAYFYLCLVIGIGSNKKEEEIGSSLVSMRRRWRMTDDDRMGNSRLGSRNGMEAIFTKLRVAQNPAQIFTFLSSE
jgi:hypothetical protein